MKTVIMKLIKENKTLVEYAEVDANGVKSKAATIQPINPQGHF